MLLSPLPSCLRRTPSCRVLAVQPRFFLVTPSSLFCLSFLPSSPSHHPANCGVCRSRLGSSVSTFPWLVSLSAQAVPHPPSCLFYAFGSRRANFGVDHLCLYPCCHGLGLDSAVVRFPARSAISSRLLRCLPACVVGLECRPTTAPVDAGGPRRRRGAGLVAARR